VIKALKVLLIEDDTGDAFLVREMLSQADKNIRIEHVERLTDGLKKITGGGDVDIVLLDINLPDSAGIGTLIKLADMANDIPIVVLTGLSDEAFGMEVVKKGA